MSSYYVGEIRMFGGNFAPANWAFCNGQLLQISQYDVLFSLIGTTYGGDGQQTFALPDLQGRTPVSEGQGTGLTNRNIGESSGTEEVTLIQQQILGHSHALNVSKTAGNSANVVSQQRMRGIQAVPQPAMAALYGVSDYGAMSLDEYYAALLAASCRTATAAASAGALRVIGYRELPDAVFTKIRPHFDIAADAATLARMRDITRFHSKSRDERYVPDSEEKELAASADLRAIAERIVGPAYRELEALAR